MFGRLASTCVNPEACNQQEERSEKGVADRQLKGVVTLATVF